ncbi:MAG: DUF4912 domain-containing protein [Sphaerochaetaceae bacterium]
MMIPNMDVLSLSELRYLAERENLDDAHLLDREELIEALQEVFEELAEEQTDKTNGNSPSSKQRYVHSLIEYDTNGESFALPGVKKLEDVYCETSIHLLFKDPYWAHAYWSVCKSDYHKLKQSVGEFELFLRVVIHESIDPPQPADSYDIDVDNNDISWNINLPLLGRSYSISLYYRDENENTGVLCQSNSITTPTSYFLEHPESLIDDPKLFDLVFSSLVSKGGVMTDTPLLREIVKKLDQPKEVS